MKAVRRIEPVSDAKLHEYLIQKISDSIMLMNPGVLLGALNVMLDRDEISDCNADYYMALLWDTYSFNCGVSAVQSRLHE